MSNIENNNPLALRAYDIRRVISEMELPTGPITLSDSEAELARGLPAAFAAYRSVDLESTDQAKGRGAAFGLIALNLGKMGVLSEVTPNSDLTLELMSSCADELENTYESVLAELSLNFPMHEEFMMDSFKSSFKKGVVSALFMIHSWASSVCGDAYSGVDIMPQEINPFAKKATPAVEYVETPLMDLEVAEPMEPDRELINKLTALSFVDDLTFKFGVEGGGAVLKVFLPLGSPLTLLMDVESIAGESRLFVENGVICLVSSI